MQRIMLATDFSERSDRALRRAALLARAHGAVLDLIHVVDDDRPSQIVDREAVMARKMLRDLAKSLETMEGVRCEAEIVLSDPFAGIATAAAERAPDLLVIGPHRRQILKDAFVGTTAERVIRSVSCPVLMVNGPPVSPYRHILLTTDLSENSESALRLFGGMGLATGARQSILYVFDAPALRLTLTGTLPEDERARHLDTQRGEARRDLVRFMQGLDDLAAEPVVRHEAADSAVEIGQAAEALNADLIVVSTQGKGAIARALLGSVTERVLQWATVDVLAIPPATQTRP